MVITYQFTYIKMYFNVNTNKMSPECFRAIGRWVEYDDENVSISVENNCVIATDNRQPVSTVQSEHKVRVK